MAQDFTALNSAVSQLETDVTNLAPLQGEVATAQTAATNASQALNIAQTNLATLNQTILTDIQVVKDAATALGAN